MTHTWACTDTYNMSCMTLAVGLTRTLRFNNMHVEARFAELQSHIHTDHAHRNTKRKSIHTEVHKQCLHNTVTAHTGSLCSVC